MPSTTPTNPEPSLFSPSKEWCEADEPEEKILRYESKDLQKMRYDLGDYASIAWSLDVHPNKGWLKSILWACATRHVVCIQSDRLVTGEVRQSRFGPYAAREVPTYFVVIHAACYDRGRDQLWFEVFYPESQSWGKIFPGDVGTVTALRDVQLCLTAEERAHLENPQVSRTYIDFAST